jgi:hypothetical protein
MLYGTELEEAQERETKDFISLGRKRQNQTIKTSLVWACANFTITLLNFALADC